MTRRDDGAGRYASPPGMADEVAPGYFDPLGVDPEQARDVARWRRAARTRLRGLRDSLSVAQRRAVSDALAAHLAGLMAERFGGAALISIIGAAPAVAASSTEDDITRDVLEEVGSDLEDATGSVIADQVSISPTIYVDQGAMVTVLVDRDVVIY